MLVVGLDGLVALRRKQSHFKFEEISLAIPYQGVIQSLHLAVSSMPSTIGMFSGALTVKHLKQQICFI